MKRVLCAVALSFLAVLPAQADDKCVLPVVARLTLKQMPSGDYAIPISIGGTEHDFVVDFSAPFSAISGKLADQLGYRSIALPKELKPQLNGEQIDHKVVIGEMGVGASHGKNFEMLRADKPFPFGGEVAGVAGLDVLENFDVDLNLNTLKLNLITPNDCDEKVYWAASYAQARLKKDPSGHMTSEMELDGHRVTVDFDVSEGQSVMGSMTLERLLHLTLQSPGMTEGTSGDTKVWRYPFKTLSLDGVVINNPHIAILNDDGPECRPETQDVGAKTIRCYGQANLRLRAGPLKAMHLYFAFKDKKLYITAADAHL
jgi:predicted aspartyl protease